MTTTTSVSPDEGPRDERWALDPFKDIRHLLPKLAIPSWVRLIGKTAEVRRKAPKPSPAAERAMRRNDRKHSRFSRALAGEHTRARRTAA